MKVHSGLLGLALMAIAASGASPAAGQQSVLGVWEIVDEDQLTVMSFRADGIMVQNEYLDGELECVFVFPYEVDGDQLRLGRGLNWEADAVTGELIPYEDYDDFSFEVRATLAFSGDELVLTLGNDEIAAQMLLFVERFLGLDPVDDLGVIVGSDLSDEELNALVIALFRAVLAEMLGIELDLLSLSDEANLSEVLELFTNALILSFLAEFLGVDADALDLDLSGIDPTNKGEAIDLLALLLTLGQDLEVDRESLESLDLTELTESFVELETLGGELQGDLTDFGTIRCVRSQRSAIGPPGEITLPNGMTAVQQRTWGQLKRETLAP